MEDALISPAGFMILSGAGLTEGTDDAKIPVHTVETTDKTYVESQKNYIIVEEALSNDSDAEIYVMVMDINEEMTEPFIGTKVTTEVFAAPAEGDDNRTDAQKELNAAQKANKLIEIASITDRFVDVEQA
jgi:hypothetical protein